MLTRIARILMLALLLALGSQLVLPFLTDAKRPKCGAVPVPGQQGTYVVGCSTLQHR